MDFHLPIAKPDSELRQELETWELDDLMQELKNISPGISAKTYELWSTSTTPKMG